NKKVWVMREFTNSAANNLGLPLPKGRVRFYRRDTDGRLEFTGENTIDHTPRDEVVRLNTGNAFDLVGEGKQTDFKILLSNTGAPYVDPTTGQLVMPPSNTNNAALPPPPWIDESFEINVRNHKKEPAEIRVVEHLYRCSDWKITAQSDDFLKM